MICPECKSNGEKSNVYPGGSQRTLMYFPPYYDENGKYHNHDSNTTTTSYRCSNGHNWSDKRRGSCWCGWGADKVEVPTEIWSMTGEELNNLSPTITTYDDQHCYHSKEQIIGEW